MRFSAEQRFSAPLDAVEAAFVGHDLNRGTSEFRRRKLAAAADDNGVPVDDAATVEEASADAA